MRILSVAQSVCYYVTTDDKDWPEFRTSGHGTWENQMGESWEPVYNDEELEKEFNRHM